MYTAGTGLNKLQSDPTTVNAQGPDRGTQYRSAIFYHSPEQKSIAEKVTAEVQEKHYKGKKIVTEIIPAGIFYDAETYHQVRLALDTKQSDRRY